MLAVFCVGHTIKSLLCIFQLCIFYLQGFGAQLRVPKLPDAMRIPNTPTTETNPRSDEAKAKELDQARISKRLIKFPNSQSSWVPLCYTRPKNAFVIHWQLKIIVSLNMSPQQRSPKVVGMKMAVALTHMCARMLTSNILSIWWS